MPVVEVYCSRFCSFCIMALRLLDDKAVSYKKLVVDGDTALRSEMVQRSQGKTTVPQIFINGQHIGGCQELYMLERAGNLDPLLNEKPET